MIGSCSGLAQSFRPPFHPILQGRLHATTRIRRIGKRRGPLAVVGGLGAQVIVQA